MFRVLVDSAPAWRGGAEGIEKMILPAIFLAFFLKVAIQLQFVGFS